MSTDTMSANESPEEYEGNEAAPASVGSGRLVRRIAIDWRAIAKETGCTRGTLACSPAFGWGVRGNGPADFCCITPPAVEANEELRIEEGVWAVYELNTRADRRGV